MVVPVSHCTLKLFHKICFLSFHTPTPSCGQLTSLHKRNEMEEKEKKKLTFGFFESAQLATADENLLCTHK